MKETETSALQTHFILTSYVPDTFTVNRKKQPDPNLTKKLWKSLCNFPKHPFKNFSKK